VRALLVLLVAGCYSPDVRDAQFTCATSTTCPSGFDCVCGVCRPTGTTGCPDFATVDDLSVAMTDDLAGVDAARLADGGSDLATLPDLRSTSTDMTTLPGCSSGPRDGKDIGKPDIALCNAAWRVAGIASTATPCSRVVDATGKNGATDCAVEDSCATGWHVCLDEADVMSHGINASDCTNLANAGAFWLTRQGGGPPPSPGPPVCMSGVTQTVFGCGQIIQVGGAPTCTLFNRALLNPPDSTDDCSTSTSGAFLCGTSGMEAATIYKPMRANGGVICCKD
jgi:hypothetical protein